MRPEFAFEASARDTFDQTRHIHASHSMCAAHSRWTRTMWTDLYHLLCLSKTRESHTINSRSSLKSTGISVRSTSSHSFPSRLSDSSCQRCCVSTSTRSSSVVEFASNATLYTSRRAVGSCAESCPVRSESACRLVAPSAISTSFTSFKAHNPACQSAR